MKNIMNETIKLTEAQNACVNYKGNKTPNLVVKGVAGSGKSLVIIKKAKNYMMEYSPEIKNKAIVFTFNNTLAASIEGYLESYEDRTDYIKVSTLDSYIYNLYRSMPGHSSTFTIDDKTKKEYIEQALKNHEEQNGGHRFHKLDVKFWIDEIKWMKDMNISNSDRSTYLRLPRKGRGGSVRMNQEDRKVAFEIFKEYNEILKKNKHCDWEDFPLFVSHNINKIPKKYKYEHVLVDEAQDMSYAKMLVVMNVKLDDVMIAMDMNQRIYNQSWNMKMLGMVATTKKLDIPFRCTKQIDALAESLRKHNDVYLDEDDVMIHAVPKFEGKKPIIVKLENESDEARYVCKIVKEWMEQDSNITIGVLAAKKSEAKIFSSWLANEEIQHELIDKYTVKSGKNIISSPGVKVLTIHSSKGLEFVRVIIPHFVEGKIPGRISSIDPELEREAMIKGRNLAYVGMTRAMKSLLITYSGKPSRFIAEMDKDLYEFVDDKYSKEKENNSYVVYENGKRVIVKPLNEKKVERMIDFFEGYGLEVIDKRPYGGYLWVIGDEDSIGDIVKEAKSKFIAGGRFGMGSTTNGRRAWYTRCRK